MFVAVVVFYLLYQLQEMITVPKWAFVLLWVSFLLGAIRLFCEIVELIADARIKP